MAHDIFLLRQLSELADALKGQPPGKRPRGGSHAYQPWSHDKRQRLLRDMTARRTAGESFGCIAQALNELGVRGEHGGRWYAASVRYFILRTRIETR